MEASEQNESTEQAIEPMVRDSVGDINEHVLHWEAEVQTLEELDQINNTEQYREDLNRGYGEYIKWLGIQESLLRHKTHIKWFKDGDCNTKYFHSVLRDRRKRIVQNQKSQE